ncbi:MAG: DnaB-like helicase C-terminal domain-containing protein [Burkholderiaceae bacterium]
MDAVDIELLKGLTSREGYDTTKDFLKTYMVTDIAWGLVKDIGEYYDQHPATDGADEIQFRTWFRVSQHPEWTHEKHKVYSLMFDSLFDGTISPIVAHSILKNRLLDCLRVASEEGKIEEVHEIYKDINELENADVPRLKLVDKSISELLSEASRLTGYEWRLEDLNRSVGPVGGGDLVLIGKRPETGGTSFMLSELTHWFEQMDKNILIVHNEESTARFMSRLVSCALGIPSHELHSDRDRYQEKYLEWLGDRRIDVLSDPDVAMLDVESYLESGEYGAVGINVVEKMKGVHGQKVEDFQKLERLGAWARRTAVLHDLPIIGVVQADMAAEGVKYPDQTMLYKSKTGLQGEADVLLMIGKDNTDESPDDSRFIHVAKNKLPGGVRSMPSLRHIKCEVRFDINTGRYTSKNSWSTI